MKNLGETETMDRKVNIYIFLCILTNRGHTEKTGMCILI